MSAVVKMLGLLQSLENYAIFFFFISIPDNFRILNPSKTISCHKLDCS